MKASRKKKPMKKIGIFALALLLLVVLRSCKQSSIRAPNHIATPTSSPVQIATILPTPTVELPKAETNKDTIRAFRTPVDTVSETVAAESFSEIGNTDDLKEYQKVTMSFYDATDLKGRGVRDHAGEPNYVGAYGYAVVYTEADLENTPGYTDTPWTIPIYVRNDDAYTLDSFIAHKTRIGIISQELTKQNGREYRGFLEFENLENGQIRYINVKNFVTVPYWDLDITNAVAKGYVIAEFRQSSQYAPVDKNGKKVIVQKDSKVLLPARGTYYVSTMNRVDYQIVGVVFEKENNKTVPQYVFFNKNDLKMVYGLAEVNMEIRADKSIYSKQVLLKTAYSFSDRAYLHLSQDDHSWIIQWTEMPDQEVKPEMFENEMISQQLREELVEKTKDIRTLLLSRAFASSALDIHEAVDSMTSDIVVVPELDVEENAVDILKGWFD